MKRKLELQAREVREKEEARIRAAREQFERAQRLAQALQTQQSTKPVVALVGEAVDGRMVVIAGVNQKWADYLEMEREARKKLNTRRRVAYA